MTHVTKECIGFKQERKDPILFTSKPRPGKDTDLFIYFYEASSKKLRQVIKVARDRDREQRAEDNELEQDII